MADLDYSRLALYRFRPDPFWEAWVEELRKDLHAKLAPAKLVNAEGLALSPSEED